MLFEKLINQLDRKQVKQKTAPKGGKVSNAAELIYTNGILYSIKVGGDVIVYINCPNWIFYDFLSCGQTARAYSFCAHRAHLESQLVSEFNHL